MIRLKRIATQAVLILAALILGSMDSLPALAAPNDPNDTHKGDLYYYTFNGIYFYEGGMIHCGDSTIAGGAAGVLQGQTNLDKRWVTLILTEANKAGADPIAMASLLFWEHRGFPEYGAGAAPGESDSVGRGPWQITAGTWPTSAGPYHTAVYDPVISTQVAANLVKNWGGVAGSPIGSIDQDFSKGKNLPSMATVAKNYNAGYYTWREPAVATYKQAGRSWLAPDRNWNNVPVGNVTKSDVIDDYILGMTFAYYTMATNTAQLTKGGGTNTATFVEAALRNTDKIKSFKFGDGGTQSGSNAANSCGSTGAGNGNIVETAFGLAWRDRKNQGHDDKSYAKVTYQNAMPDIQGKSTAESVYENKTAWTDCGVFVATTIRLSGADPEYQKRGTALQLPYVIRNGDPNDPNRKYDIFRDFNNVSQVKPGDIFIVSGGDVGHTFIFTGPYTGDDGKKYDSASASWGQRVPMASNAYFEQEGYHYIVARLRKNAAATADTATGGAQP
ncbi:MAG TPA: hypothetical protein VM581_00045 [Magnetospirillaceae bacterium]|nr:hypothetical protein [Magnetospirillaceae bacterium]